MSWRFAPWLGAFFILLLPLVAMQFTDSVNWDSHDFLVGAVLLFGACAIFELSIRLAGKTIHRLVIGVAVVLTVLFIWADLAVGIFK